MATPPPFPFCLLPSSFLLLLFGRRLFGRLGGTLFRRGRGTFLGALGGGFFAGLGTLFALGRGFALFALFPLFLDHLDIARRHRFGGGRRRLFLFRARHGHCHVRDVLATENFDAGG